MSPVRNAFVSRQSRIPPGPPKFIQLIFPGIKSDSFLMYLMMAQALIYIVTLCVGEHLLNPTADSLITCGASTFNLTFREFQFWRLFTSIFLMANVESLIFISWIQWTMGAETELKYGKIKTAAIVFIPGAITVLLSTWTQMVSIVIGGVYPLMTLFGFNIMECVFDWNRIEDKDSCMMTIFFNLAFLFFFGNGLTNTDGFGSFVSLILGCVTCWLIRRFTKDCDVVLPSFG
eukprot:GHVH01015853.1.p1 GENE.GHVH01015853.1~~GHVH01015853.1.p1  ORF type:complete len:232 (+),score=29.20 GHVH01015853.1:173-868(+)